METKNKMKISLRSKKFLNPEIFDFTIKMETIKNLIGKNRKNEWESKG